MPPTLRLWDGLGRRGRLPSGFGNDHTSCEHSESHFSPLFILLLSFKSGKCVTRGPQRVPISAANEFFTIPRGKFLLMSAVQPS